MEGKYKARIEETIHQLVAELLMRRVKDPRVANVSVLRVEASRDYSVAKIYYNIIGGSDDLEDVQKGLQSCKGFIRGKLKKHLRTRVIPELIFIYDSSLDRAMALEEIIERIHDEDASAGSAGGDDNHVSEADTPSSSEAAETSGSSAAGEADSAPDDPEDEESDPGRNPDA